MLCFNLWVLAQKILLSLVKFPQTWLWDFWTDSCNTSLFHTMADLPREMRSSGAIAALSRVSQHPLTNVIYVDLALFICQRGYVLIHTGQVCLLPFLFFNLEKEIKTNKAFTISMGAHNGSIGIVREGYGKER